MHQHRKGMTSSNTSAGGLDLRCKDDYNFLRSIDNGQMVKNVCASQEYFQWDIFLTFTGNMRKIGKKRFCELLDDNEWTMYFPNWDTYYFSSSDKEKELYINLLRDYFCEFGKKSTLFLLIIS